MRKLTKIWAALFLFAGLGGVRAEVANPPTEFPEAPAESADEVLALHSSHYGVTDGIKDILDNSAAKVGSVKDVEGRQMISIENALNSWVHINFNKTIDISTYGTLHMDVYVVKGAFDCKMQFASNTANVFLSSEKLAEGWNRVVLNLADFTNAVNPADLTQVKEIALINNGGYARTIYVDNIYVSGKTGDTPLDPEMPAEMAPAPTHDASKVKSIFSDTYTSYAEVTQLTGTGTMKIFNVSAQQKIMKIEGGLNHWANLNFNPSDFSDRSHLHLDIYIVRETGTTTLKFRFDETSGGNEVKLPLEPGWNYLDIPLADFNANLVAATQFRIINNSGSAINVFIDNLYTYGDDNTSVNPDDPTAPATSAPAPEHPEEDVVSLFSDAYETTLSLSQTHPGEPSSQMEVIDLSEGDQAIRFTGMNWTLVGINPAANLEGMEWIHFDVYAINTPKLNIGMGDVNGNEGAAATQYLQMGWNSIDLPMNVFTQANGSKPGVQDLTQVNLLRLWSASGFAISKLYFDNIYAYKGNPGGEVITYEIDQAPEPIMPHTTSSRLTKYVVKSLYSDKYTALTELTESAVSDGTTLSFPNIEQGDGVIKMTALNEVSLQTAASVDLSDTEYIHFNVYRKGTEGTLEIGFRSEGMAEDAFVATKPELKSDEWCYVNIPVSELTAGGVDAAKLTHVSFRGQGDLYVDNIYATSGEYFLGLGEEGKVSIDWAEAMKDDELPDRNSALIGLNLASACGGDVHGKVNTNYFYPTRQDLYYFKSQGARLFRFPFRWERVQHELNGELDLAQDVDSMKQTIAEAERLGMWVMPDMHNYCRYTEVVNGQEGTVHLFGESDVLTKEAFADVWRKLANEFKDFSNIWGYDIMNEPYGMDYAYWKEYAQAAINAIREVDTETPIVIEGCQYASASNWPTLSDDLKNLTDPSDKLVFSAHCYFDNQSSGLYDGTYDEEVNNENVHINRLSRWVNWLKENNKQGILGEFGVPRDDARWLMMLDEVCAYLKENGVSGTYWVGGNGYANDEVSIQPQENYTVERAQIRVLRNYFSENGGESGIEAVTGDQAASLHLYPNPVTTQVSIDAPVAMQTVRVFTATGSEVKAVAVDGTHADLDLSDLDGGLYFISAETLDGKLSIGKIIKQ